MEYPNINADVHRYLQSSHRPNAQIYKDSILYYNLLWNQYANYYSNLMINIMRTNGTIDNNFVIYNINDHFNLFYKNHYLLPITLSDNFFSNRLFITVVNPKEGIIKNILLEEFIITQEENKTHTDNKKYDELISFLKQSFPKQCIFINYEGKY